MKYMKTYKIGISTNSLKPFTKTSCNFKRNKNLYKDYSVVINVDRPYKISHKNILA